MEADWRSARRAFDAAERFTAAARKYLHDSQGSVPAAAAASRAFGDFLRDESMGLFQPGGGTATGAAIGAGSGWPGATPPLTPFDPRSFDAALEMPAFGPTREHQLRWQRTQEAGRRSSDAQRRLLLLWSDALRDAAAAFMERLAQLTASAPTSVAAPAPGAAFRTLYAAWIDCAEAAYGRTARSEPFCDAFTDFVNASAAWRAEVQAAVEHWAQALDLPTRSELNTLTRRLKVAEDELRAERAARASPQQRRAPRARRATRPKA